MGAFAPVTSEISRSYNSLSGTDIHAVIGTEEFAEIQAISYSITREKAPIYTMGSANPRAFSRNKRGIAGSLVWINFDRHALLALINDQGGTFVANTDEIRPQYTVTDGTFIGQSTIFGASITNPLGIPASATIQQSSNLPMTSVSRIQSPGHALGLGPDPAVDYPGGVLVQLGVSRAPVPGDGLLTALEHLRIKIAYLACACEISDP